MLGSTGTAKGEVADDATTANGNIASGNEANATLAAGADGTIGDHRAESACGAENAGGRAASSMARTAASAAVLAAQKVEPGHLRARSTGVVGADRRNGGGDWIPTSGEVRRCEDRRVCVLGGGRYRAEGRGEGGL